MYIWTGYKKLTRTAHTSQKHNQALVPPAQLQPPLAIPRRNVSDARDGGDFDGRRWRGEPRVDFEGERFGRHP